jgi:hypothetical protein
MNDIQESSANSKSFKGWVCFDVDSYEPETFSCLPIVRTVRAVDKDMATDKKSTNYVVWRILAVERRLGKAGELDLTFARVGYGEVFGEHWFDDCEPCEFTFV